MNFEKIFAAVVICGMLVSCSSLSDLDGGPIADSAFADPDKGVILISTAAPGQCKLTAMWAHIHERTSNKLVENAPMIPIDTNRNSDFPNFYGSLRAVSLSPGSYYLTASFTSPGLGTTALTGFAFDVRAGEMTYVGELAKKSSCDEMTRYQVSDEYDRDLDIAKSKYPTIRSRTPAKRLLQRVPISIYTR
jgi:hypothetical protein